MQEYDFDLITIGAGSGGVRASRLAGGYGARVAIVEKSRVGGTCVMRGCVPKKLLVYGAHYADEFEDARGYRLDRRRRAARLGGADRGEEPRARPSRRRLWRHPAAEQRSADRRQRRFSRTRTRSTWRVGAFTAEKILIACGGWPTLPNIPGIEHAITSNEALELPELPTRMVIVGGGYIAVEFAGIFRAAGARGDRDHPRRPRCCAASTRTSAPSSAQQMRKARRHACCARRSCARSKRPTTA